MRGTAVEIAKKIFFMLKLGKEYILEEFLGK